MDDFLEVGSAWLVDQQDTYISKSVVYHRGAGSVTVTAMINQTSYDLDNEFGLIETFQMRDFMILASKLIIAAVNILPIIGDTIVETRGSIVRTYEVMSPGSLNHYKFSDLYNLYLRIHTKEIDVT